MNGKLLSRAGVVVAVCTSVAVTVATIMAGGPFDRLDWKRFDRAYYVDPGLDVDTDGDGAPDVSDNCAFDANPTQTNTDAANPAANHPGADAFGDACDDDIDGDGYTAAQEAAVVPAKSDTAYCDIMRADITGDGLANALDLGVLAQWFLQAVPPAPERVMLNEDGLINALDLGAMASVFLQPVSACP